jgi:hypothetical protein
MNDKVKVPTKEIIISGIGTIDQCDHCKVESTIGASCWYEYQALDICYLCLDKYYKESK